MKQDSGRLQDGFLSVEGGVDSGFPPSLIQRNQLAWAVNATCRGGFITARPGWWKRLLDFQGDLTLQADFESGLFQGAGTYVSDDGATFLAVAVSGRIFLVNLSSGFRVTEITGTAGPLTPDRPHVWFQQAENYLIAQNGLDLPFLYNGASSRRANTGGLGGSPMEVPIGGPMAYGKGRLWVAMGSKYYGGDLVWSHQDLGRGSIIRFTENTFLNEGGAFAVADGPITGMSFAANIDTALGDGDLLVFTATNAYAFSAPVDREVWKDLRYPIQRFALLNFGSTNHEAIATVNGDLFFRALDGVRSFIYAVRDFDQWGNTPISRQIGRALQFDTQQLLTEASAVTFDNRLLMTCQPQRVSGHGVIHRALLALDFNLVSGMGQKLPPAWEGVWTGLRILRIINARVANEERCFILALGTGDIIEIFEVSRSGLFDFNGQEDVPPQWIIETRGMIFGDPFDRKRLESAEQWYDQLAGEAEFRFLYKSNESACWNEWGRQSDCAQYRSCAYNYPCLEVKFLKPAARSRIALPTPPERHDPQTGGLTNQGFEFQMRVEITGRLRMKRMTLVARSQPEQKFGDISKFQCTNPPDSGCQTDCLQVECAGYCGDPPDYNYQIS